MIDLNTKLCVLPLAADQGKSIALCAEAPGNTVVARITPGFASQRESDEANLERLAACWNAMQGRTLAEIEAFAKAPPVTLATDDEIAIASDKFGSEVIQIDDGAHASHGDNGTWVQAWVLILNDERDDNYAEDSVWPGDADHAAARGLPAEGE